MSSRAGICRDVLQEIVERISLHKDILGYAAVCKQWRSIVMGNLHRLPHKLPLCYCLPRQHPLPLLVQCNDEEVSGKIEFFSVLDNKSLTNLSVPEISGNWIAGSFNGWLVLVEILGRQRINLLNPFTRAQITLPPLSAFKPPKGSFEDDLDDFGFVRKALVISKPNARDLDGCIVIVIVSCLRVLSFCRPGDEKWTNIEGSPIHVDDVISYKGQLYAVVTGGTLISFNVELQRGLLVAGFATNERENGRMYLVESTAGDLLAVGRFEDDEVYSTRYFSVYKLEEVDETQVGVVEASYATVSRRGRVSQAVKYRWVELESVEDEILFIGLNCSKSVPASLYPDLKGNCIYFTDDDPYFRHMCVTRHKAGISGVEYDEECFNVDVNAKYDMGIYDMEDGSIQPMDEKLFRIPPVWLEPNPW